MTDEQISAFNEVIKAAVHYGVDHIGDLKTLLEAIRNFVNLEKSFDKINIEVDILIPQLVVERSDTNGVV